MPLCSSEAPCWRALLPLPPHEGTVHPLEAIPSLEVPVPVPTPAPAPLSSADPHRGGPPEPQPPSWVYIAPRHYARSVPVLYTPADYCCVGDGM